MTDATPTRRVLPARQRRESAARRLASSPPPLSKPVTPAAKTPATPATDDSKTKKPSVKKIKTIHVATPSRSASTPTSITDDVLPTKLITSKPLPTSLLQQSVDVANGQFQSIADSAILAASLHRSRMQWLCDGIFKKYWTKPIKRKKVTEEPPNNPDAKSMQKLGTAAVTIEPHTFDATFYVVREAQPPAPRPLPPPVVKPPVHPVPSGQPVQPVPPAPSAQPALPAPPAPPAQPAPRAQPTPPAQQVQPTPPVQPVRPVSHQPTPATPATSNPAPPKPAPTNITAPLGAASAAKPSVNASVSPAVVPAPTPAQPATPPAGARTTDPVIQMLASRAATDNHLKELMKVVATSKANAEQLKEFQAHIDEFNAIVKRQEAEKAARARLAAATAHRSSPLNPHFAQPVQPRPEPIIKYVVMEFTSPPVSGHSANPDRWLFPEFAVLDTQYGGTEMTCSFLVERKGADILAAMKDLTPEEAQAMSAKWKPDLDYFQPVTMVVRAAQHRTIETIARSAKSLPEVQKYMEDVMGRATRAPQEHLVLRLPRDKVDNSLDFVDSAVELSAEDDELKDSYPL